MRQEVTSSKQEEVVNSKTLHFLTQGKETRELGSLLQMPFDHTMFSLF